MSEYNETMFCNHVKQLASWASIQETNKRWSNTYMQENIDAGEMKNPVLAMILGYVDRITILAISLCKPERPFSSPIHHIPKRLQSNGNPESIIKFAKEVQVLQGMAKEISQVWQFLRCSFFSVRAPCFLGLAAMEGLLYLAMCSLYSCFSHHIIVPRVLTIQGESHVLPVDFSLCGVDFGG